MSTYAITAAQEIAAPADRVYRILADYRNHHPRILPPAIHDLTVEEGGTGAGTIIRYNLTLLGREQEARARVEEPEPGRVLAEHDLSRDFTTTFTVTPIADGCELRIETTASGTGARGLVERLLVPRMLKPIYAQELANIDRYAREHPDV